MSMRPLLTLAICCYKFERFIDEALDGAFAQTYRPLEIVVSDDCSPDGSWQRILDKVSSVCSDRPLDRTAVFQTIRLADDLTLVLNRNPSNLGLARHENRLFELSHGEWIAFQAGDDVSASERMARVAERVTARPNIRCLHCLTDVIDATGKPFEIPDSFKRQRQRSKNRKTLPNVLGAGAVYHRDVYAKFGPLAPFCQNEDHALPLRAALLGDIELIEEPLVRYRKHGANASGAYSTDALEAARYRLRLVGTYHQELQDLLVAEREGMAAVPRIRRYRRMVEEEIFIQRFFGLRVLRPELRTACLWELMASPRRVGLFVRRFIGRMG